MNQIRICFGYDGFNFIIKYLDEETFNHFKVPIPTIDEQKEILKRIQKHTKKIEIAKREILNQENSILSIIDEIVGED